MKQLLLVAFGLISQISLAHADQFRASHQYHCFATQNSYNFLLNVNLNNFVGKIQVNRDVADLDQNYAGQPRALRFVYEESDEGTTEAILQAELLNGTPRGGMAIITRGEDTARTTYTCTLIR